MHCRTGKQLQRRAVTLPLISVIVPTLNEARTLAPTLNPLQSQRQRDIEIILVDGGSSDETIDIAAPLVDTLMECQPGRALQMNTGAACAKGDLLLFLHADTLLSAKALPALKSLLQEKSEFWGRFDVTADSDRWIYQLVTRMMNLRSCVTRVATGDQAMFIHRSLFLKSGGFPEIPLMEDIAISKKLRKIQRPLCLRSKAIISTRYWQRNGVTRSILRMWRLRLVYFLGVSPHRLVQQYYRENG